MLGMGLPLSVAFIASETLLEKTNFFLCLRLLIGDSFWVRDGALNLSSSLITGTHVEQTCAGLVHALIVYMSSPVHPSCCVNSLGFSLSLCLCHFYSVVS